MVRALPIIAVVALLPVGASSPADDAWWDASGLDRDRDGIDDALAGAAGPVRVLLSYARAPTDAQVRHAEQAGATVISTIRVVPVLVVDTTADRLPDLARSPGVVLVEKDRPLRLQLDESRPLVGGDRAAEDFDVTGRGVTIAVLDTGVDPVHADLGDRLLATYDASIPRTPLDPILGNRIPVVPTDTNGHGTHVAGIAAGPGTASGGRYAGIAPDAGLVSVKVFDAQGDSFSSYVLRGIDWVLDRKDALRIRIFQMSLGGGPTDGTDALSRGVDAAADRGLLPVVAAGNDGPEPGTVGIPGVAARALTVGAVDKSLAIAQFTSRGPTPDGRQKPDIVAPGVDITSTLPALAARGQSYGSLSGTSMAAPHVAGAAALLFEANATLSPAEAKWILTVTSQSVGPQPGVWDPAFGWGFLDVAAAVEAARSPSLLTLAPFDLKARAVPVDGGDSPLERLAFELESGRRSIPVGMALLPLAAVLAAACPPRRRE